MADDLERFRRRREALESLSTRIERARATLDDLYTRRRHEWAELDAAGVPRSTCAKWSGVDPMMVTRALQEEA